MRKQYKRKKRDRTEYHNLRKLKRLGFKTTIITQEKDRPFSLRLKFTELG